MAPNIKKIWISEGEKMWTESKKWKKKLENLENHKKMDKKNQNPPKSLKMHKKKALTIPPPQ